MERYSISLVIRKMQIKLTNKVSTCKCYHIRKKGHYRCDEVKELEMERSSRIIQVNPKRHYMYP